MPLNLASFGEASPSGEDLEYEKVFTDLELAARPEEERQIGTTFVAGQEPDPKRLMERAEAVLEQSHDLRAAVYYGYGATRVDGFSGLRAAIGYIRGCLEQYWDTCHPQLEAEDDNDPTMRVNAVRGLVETTTVLRAVRQAPMTQSQAFGRMSLNDLMIAEGELPSAADMENPPDMARLNAAFQDTPHEWLAATLTELRQTLADLDAIDAVFDSRTPGQGPNLAPLMKLLRRAAGRLADVVGEPAPEEVAMDPDHESGGSGAETRPARNVPGEIRSSRDVEHAIDRIVAYYREHEPSSPVPMILTRARRLVGADFMTIVADIAPGGQDSVKMIGGIDDT